jgi:parallel beta-helix repeat protein
LRKKTLVTSIILSALLFSAVAGTQFVTLGRGNPFIHDYVQEGEVSPPEGTQPPEITILYPNNNTAYASSNVSFTFNVSMPESNEVSLSLSEVYYRLSWQSSNTFVELQTRRRTTFSIKMTVPEGPRWIVIYAVARGFSHETRHEIKGIISTTYYVGYKIIGSSAVNFTIDTTPPEISVSAMKNLIYDTSDVPLSFTVNESDSQTWYSLDGKDNVTFAGDTILTGLSEGEHKVTVYATDNAGNTGASEAVCFSIVEPQSFPTAIMAPTALVVVAGLALLIYFKKRKARPPANLRPKVLFTVTFLSVILLPMVIGMLPIRNVSGNFIYQPEQVPEGIRINTDGTVEGTVNIQRNGNTYTLTSNLYRTIAVLRDGIVLDGAGYTLRGNGTGSGVFLQERNSVTIKSLKISNFEYGIKFTWALLGGQPVGRNNKIIGNTILNNKYGIVFNDYSEGNWISDNYIAYNSHGFQLHQSNSVLRNNKFVGNNCSISDYGSKINDIDTSNTVNGKPVYYWVNQHDRTVPSDAGWVVLRNCSRIRVENLNLEGNAQGIFLYNTNSTTINGNTVTNNGDGIVLLTSSNNTISNNNLAKNGGCGVQLQSGSTNNSIIENRICKNARQGISLSFSNGTTISKNHLAANECGIKLEFAKESDITENNVTLNRGIGVELSFETCNNTISRNAISKNALGISLGPTSQILPAGNIITENVIRENNGWGVKTDPSQSKNVIHHNNFIDNNVTEGLQVSNPGQWTLRGGRAQWLPGNPNAWDDGREGNYWSDYEARYPDADKSENSEVWNTPFYINENNIDGFPLMSPWEIHPPETEKETTLDTVPFPTMVVVASFVTLSVFGFGLLLNLIKRKKAKD